MVLTWISTSWRIRMIAKIQYFQWFSLGSHLHYRLFSWASGCVVFADINNEHVYQAGVAADQQQTVAEYIRSNYGITHALTGYIVLILFAYITAFLGIAAYALKKFNFQDKWVLTFLPSIWHCLSVFCTQVCLRGKSSHCDFQIAHLTWSVQWAGRFVFFCLSAFQLPAAVDDSGCVLSTL